MLSNPLLHGLNNGAFISKAFFMELAWHLQMRPTDMQPRKLEPGKSTETVQIQSL